ncbi:MAG: hypothetical protein QOJ11_560 [Frankiales bacterium]|jgi:hypothetical protein|nr:hypothetical protein [Frankiales bacterium]
MTDLEHLLRDTLTVHGNDAPDASGLLAGVHQRRRQRHRRRVQAGAALTAVTTVAALVTAGMLLTSHRQPSTVGNSTTTPAPAPTTSGTTPTSAGVPAGTQAVSLAGVEVFVPKAWKLNDERCGTPIADTAINDNGRVIPTCLIMQPHRLTVVRIERLSTSFGTLRASVATTTTTVDGQPARRGTGVLAQLLAPITSLVLPKQGVVVSVESPDPAAIQQILDSVRVVSVDANGCATAMPLFTVRGHPETLNSRLQVPASATTAVICRYSATTLAQSTPLTTSQRGTLAGILNALSVGVSHIKANSTMVTSSCADSAARGFVVQFAYPGKAALRIFVRIEGCGALFASDGTHTTKLNEQLIETLVGISGYDGNTPGPGQLQ